MSLIISILLQLEHLPSMVTGVWSDDHNLQLESTTLFRKLLSIGLCLFYNTFFECLVLYQFFTNLIYVCQSVALQSKRLLKLV